MRKTVFAFIVLLAVALALVVPFHPEAGVLRLLHAVTPDTAAVQRADWLIVETGGNLLAFGVVGAAVFVIGRRYVAAVLIGCGISAAAELGQLLIPSRVASITDFVTNSIGTVIGTLIAAVIARSQRRAQGETDRPRPR